MARRRARLYGIAPEQIERLIASQDNKCAICLRDLPTDRRPSIDHDHLSGAVRGVLCTRCNTGIGMLGDDPDLMEAAAQYVRTHRAAALRLVS